MKKMKKTKMFDLLIDTVASPEIGRGHVSRCLTLAKAGWVSQGLSRAWVVDENNLYMQKILKELEENNILFTHIEQAEYVIKDHPLSGFYVCSNRINFYIDVFCHGECPNSDRVVCLRGMQFAIVDPVFRLLSQGKGWKSGNANKKNILIIPGYYKNDKIERLIQGIVTILTNLTPNLAKSVIIKYKLSREELIQEMKHARVLITKIGQTSLESMCLGIPTVIFDQRGSEHKYGFFEAVVQAVHSIQEEEVILVKNEDEKNNITRFKGKIDGLGAMRIWKEIIRY